MQTYEVIIATEQLKGNLANIINNSGLLACQVESVLKNILNEVHELSKIELEQAIRQYEEVEPQKKENKSEVVNEVVEN